MQIVYFHYGHIRPPSYHIPRHKILILFNPICQIWLSTDHLKMCMLIAGFLYSEEPRSTCLTQRQSFSVSLWVHWSKLLIFLEMLETLRFAVQNVKQLEMRGCIIRTACSVGVRTHSSECCSVVPEASVATSCSWNVSANLQPLLSQCSSMWSSFLIQRSSCDVVALFFFSFCFCHPNETPKMRTVNHFLYIKMWRDYLF